MQGSIMASPYSGNCQISLESSTSMREACKSRLCTFLFGPLDPKFPYQYLNEGRLRALSGLIAHHGPMMLAKAFVYHLCDHQLAEQLLASRNPN